MIFEQRRGGFASDLGICRLTPAGYVRLWYKSNREMKKIFSDMNQYLPKEKDIMTM